MSEFLKARHWRSATLSKVLSILKLGVKLDANNFRHLYILNMFLKIIFLEL